MTAPGKSSRVAVVTGILWTSGYQIFQAAVNFGAMLLLVRVIPPVEYGRWSAVVGLLLLLNTCSCRVFMFQALQLPEGVEPDWSLHWSAGFYIQTALALATNAIAGVLWLIPRYAPVAPLLHWAALGIWFDWPNQLADARLRRHFDFRRMRVLCAAGALLSIGVTVTLGLAGYGALALVLGGNVVVGTPFGLDLLLIQRWRPRSGWWMWPRWSSYRPALMFGVQQLGSAMLNVARSTLEAALLPAAVGFGAIGFWNRAQALYNSSLGRAATVLQESIYPFLPRFAAEPERYRKPATLYVQTMCWVLIPGALYVGLQGPALSRLLYGNKWIGADPLIWPGTIAAAAIAMFFLPWFVLLGVSRLKSCLVLDASAASAAVPGICAALVTRNMALYAWAIASTALVVSALAFKKASPLLLENWPRLALLPPLTSSLVAAITVLGVNRLIGGWGLPLRLAFATAAYGSVVLAVLRAFFAQAFAEWLENVPGSGVLQRWLRLRTPAMQTAGATSVSTM